MASAQYQVEEDPVHDVSHFPEEEEIRVDGHEFGPDAFDPGYSIQPDQATSFTTSKTLKEEEEKTKDEVEKAKNDANRDIAEKIKASLIVSGAVVAVIGAILAISKKIREA